jgi:hypothetical protein
MTSQNKKIISQILLVPVVLAEIVTGLALVPMALVSIVCTGGVGLVVVIPLALVLFGVVKYVNKGIKRFGGLIKPEDDTANKHTWTKTEQSLVNYFIKSQKEGSSDETAIAHLKENGWTDADIQNARRIVDTLPNPPDPTK